MPGLGSLLTTIAGDYTNTSKELKKSKQSGVIDAAQQLEGLKANIQETLELICEELNLEKIIIFVDDLDRLPARYATEILEVFKVLLDIDQCVFVLAIDFAVIQQGLREKYNDNITELHVKKFFDKIVQVPFHVPLLRAGHKAYLKRALGAILMNAPTRKGFNGQTSEGASVELRKLDEYVNMVPGEEFSNFRELKRLLNSFSLVILIAAGASEDVQLDEDWTLDLFGALCLQMAFPDIYLQLSSEEEELFLERVQRLSEDDELEILFDGSRGRLESFRRFFEVLGRRFQYHGSTVGNAAHDSSETGGEKCIAGKWDVRRFLSACRISSTVTKDTLSKSARSKDEKRIRFDRAVRLSELTSDNKKPIYSMALLVSEFVDMLDSRVVKRLALSHVPSFEDVFGESRKILWEFGTKAFYLSAPAMQWGWFHESVPKWSYMSYLDLCGLDTELHKVSSENSDGEPIERFLQPIFRFRIYIIFSQESLFFVLRPGIGLGLSGKAADSVNESRAFCIANKDEGPFPGRSLPADRVLVFRAIKDRVVSGDQVADEFLSLLKTSDSCIVDR